MGRLFKCRIKCDLHGIKFIFHDCCPLLMSDMCMVAWARKHSIEIQVKSKNQKTCHGLI